MRQCGWSAFFSVQFSSERLRGSARVGDVRGEKQKARASHAGIRFIGSLPPSPSPPHHKLHAGYRQGALSLENQSPFLPGWSDLHGWCGEAVRSPHAEGLKS